MQGLISVIVPVYNVRGYLRKCLDSILSQTYSKLEIILVNDGSTDGSDKICEEYAGKEPRVKLIHKANGGLGSARNAGIQVCRGSYLMFVDSDDYLSTDAVQTLYERIVSDRSDMVIAKHTDTYEDGHFDDFYCAWMKDAILTKHEFLLTMGAERHYPVCAWAKLYRRELFEGVLYPKHTCGEDLWVFPFLIDRCQSISVADRVIYYYVQRNTSITHQKNEQRKKDALDACLHIICFFWKQEVASAANKWFGRYVDAALELQCPKEALSLLSQYFAPKEQKELRKRASLKTRLKIQLLRFPACYKAMQRCKEILNGR